MTPAAADSNLGKLRDITCPACRSPLTAVDGSYNCSGPDCGATYPVVDGCPVLINERSSIFEISDFVSRRVTTMDLRDTAARRRGVGDILRDLLNRVTPSVSNAISDFDARAAIADVVARSDGEPRILVIGAGDERLDLGGGCDIVYSDVALGGLTNLICDAHDIPFPDEYFDAVLAVAVLEHVADPVRVVAEIHRVLRDTGFVYAVTPFMQQVHMGRYDFTRFSHVGHRRLFRWFSEERSGVANGPGMALAWSIDRYFAGLSGNATIRSLLRTFARIIGFPFSLSDSWFSHGRAAYDNASGYYFFGRKAGEPLSDREIVATYRGTMTGGQ